jgi:hypothetical protein
MCWEQSQLKRTIATSRSDDNRGESAKSDDHNRPGITATYEPKKLATTLSATLTQNPEGKLIPLDRLFQERSHRPLYCALKFSVFCTLQ